MLLILATSWHYWYIPVHGGGAIKSQQGSAPGAEASSSVLVSQPSPAVEIDGLCCVIAWPKKAATPWTPQPHNAFPADPLFPQLIAVCMDCARFPIRRRGDKHFWSPPCLGETFLGWRRLTGFGSPQMLRSVSAKTQMLKVHSINNYNL